MSTADDTRMSEIEYAFEVVRGGQLHGFLTCPRLAWEVRDIWKRKKFGEVLEAFDPDGPGSCTPCVFPLSLEEHQCKVEN